MEKKKILCVGILIGAVIGFSCSILVRFLCSTLVFKSDDEPEIEVIEEYNKPLSSEDLLTIIENDESKPNNSIIKFKASRFDKYDLPSTLPIIRNTTEAGMVVADSAFTCTKNDADVMTFLRDQSFCQDFIVIKNYYKRDGDEKVYTRKRTAEYASVNYDVIEFINENLDDEMYNIRIEVIYDDENTYGIDNLLDDLIVEYDEEVE